jgi:hypothetical protein
VWLQHHEILHEQRTVTGTAPGLSVTTQQAPEQKINARRHTHLIPVSDFIST